MVERHVGPSLGYYSEFVLVKMVPHELESLLNRVQHQYASNEDIVQAFREQVVFKIPLSDDIVCGRLRG